MTRPFGTFAAGLLVAAVILLGVAQVASADFQVRVRPGDTLWAFAHQYHVSVAALVKRNHIRNPSLIYIGQRLTVPAPPVPRHATVKTAPELSHAQVQALLVSAAHRHGLNPAFIEAVAWWESGWNQNAISPDGAIGIMQVMPATGAWVGPALLGRKVNLHSPSDNVAVGAALLQYYFHEFGNQPKLVLAAYYQGGWSAAHRGILKSSRHYVDGIWALRNLIQSGKYRFR